MALYAVFFSHDSGHYIFLKHGKSMKLDDVFPQSWLNVLTHFSIKKCG